MSDLSKLFSDFARLLRDAREAYSASGDPADARLLKTIEYAAPAAVLKRPKRKGKPSHKARKRKAFRGMVRLNADGPILPLVRKHVD